MGDASRDRIALGTPRLIARLEERDTDEVPLAIPEGAVRHEVPATAVPSEVAEAAGHDVATPPPPVLPPRQMRVIATATLRGATCLVLGSA